ncbi:MAG TPA: HU family DNA-binding protein [Pseudomonadota bacterium]|jgi:integration host factor beta subunit|nr:HU family DNA-binding protein [Deltaproteobacteria bacterium]HPH28892.1 HU family DNA-binding protein [Pseudomonadota bacterium]
MKKSDLVDMVASKNKIPKAQTQQVLEDIFNEISTALSSGEKIDLRGFGTFSVRASKPRAGRNPQTGDKIMIPARRVPGFKPGKELKDRCNLS